VGKVLLQSESQVPPFSVHPYFPCLCPCGSSKYSRTYGPHLPSQFPSFVLEESILAVTYSRKECKFMAYKSCSALNLTSGIIW
jgi:hypothetical protein